MNIQNKRPVFRGLFKWRGSRVIIGVLVFGMIVLAPTPVRSQSTQSLLTLIAALREQIAILQSRVGQQGVPTTTGTVGAAAPAIFTRDLDINSTGADVAQLQQFLIDKGFLRLPPGVVKGTFGPLTKLALASYQKAVGIYPAVGYFGPRTRTFVASQISGPVLAVNTLNPAVSTTTRRRGGGSSGGGGGGGNGSSSNSAPTVSAGSDQSITLPTNSISLSGSASDDGRPNNTLTTTWSKYSGTGTVVFSDANSLTSTATFPGAGTYVLRLSASDTDRTSTDDMTVTVASQTSNPVGENDECVDGNDNDNDGLTDFEDFGCLGPNYQETNTNYGFTRFTPSGDSRIVYVSSSTGNDSYTGLCPEPTSGNCGPKLTISAGASLIRNGYPDWLLFKRGDSWIGNLISHWANQDGRSNSERIVVSSYGTSPTRPLFKIGSSDFFIGLSRKHLAFSGLDIYAHTRDPDSGEFVSSAGGFAFKFVYSSQNILLEDTAMRFTRGITVESSNVTGQPNPGCWENFVNVGVRRNIFWYSYSTVDVSHAGAIYSSGGDDLSPGLCAGSGPKGGRLEIEGNFFNHNGWYDENVIPGSQATEFSRDLYVTRGWGNTIVNNNIMINGASGGIQLRMGGTAENNLLIDQPLALTFGHAQNPGSTTVGGSIKNNVILGSRNISDAQPRGYGILFSSYNTVTDTARPGASHIRDLEISNNLVANNIYGTGGLYGLSANTLDGNGTFDNVDVFDNVVYNWARPSWPGPNINQACALGFGTLGQSTNFSVHNNSFQQPNKGFAGCTGASVPSGVSLFDNSYFSTSQDSAAISTTGWFSINGAVASATWLAQLAESNANLTQVSYPGADRTIATYMDSIGENESLEAFIQEASEQSRTYWRDEFEADTVNDYFRDGFNMDTASAGSRSANLAQVQGVVTGDGMVSLFFKSMWEMVVEFFRHVFGVFHR